MSFHGFRQQYYMVSAIVLFMIVKKAVLVLAVLVMAVTIVSFAVADERVADGHVTSDSQQEQATVDDRLRAYESARVAYHERVRTTVSSDVSSQREVLGDFIRAAQARLAYTVALIEDMDRSSANAQFMQQHHTLLTQAIDELARHERALAEVQTLQDIRRLNQEVRQTWSATLPVIQTVVLAQTLEQYTTAYVRLEQITNRIDTLINGDQPTVTAAIGDASFHLVRARSAIASAQSIVSHDVPDITSVREARHYAQEAQQQLLLARERLLTELRGQRI